MKLFDAQPARQALGRRMKRDKMEGRLAQVVLTSGDSLEVATGVFHADRMVACYGLREYDGRIRRILGWQGRWVRLATAEDLRAMEARP